MKKTTCLTVLLSVIVLSVLPGCSSDGGSQAGSMPGQVTFENQNSTPETEKENVVNPETETREVVDIFIKYIDDTLIVRSEPQHDSSAVTKVDVFYTRMYYYGQKASGLGSDNRLHDWYQVRLDSGDTGWVRSDLVISQDANVRYPYASDQEGTDLVKYSADTPVNIRSEPSANSSLVGTVTDCNTFLHSCFPGNLKEGPGSDGNIYNWVRVVVNSTVEGWVRDDLVFDVNMWDVSDMVFVKKTAKALNIRVLPQYDSQLVAEIKNADTRLYYWGKDGTGLGSDGKEYTWYWVAASSSACGWVRSDLVKEAPYLGF